jgi:hypothetical protein
MHPTAHAAPGWRVTSRPTIELGKRASTHRYEPRLARDNALDVALDVSAERDEVLCSPRISRRRVARDMATAVSHAASNLSLYSADLAAEASA